MPLGPVEMVVLAVVLTLLFGTARVASLARTAGLGVREIKQPLAEAKAMLSLDAPPAEARPAEPAEPAGEDGGEPPADPLHPGPGV